MTAFIVFVLVLTGFAALALSMRRHQNVAPSFKRYRARLQGTGWALLLTSLIASVMQPHSSIRIVEWVFLLTAAGVPVVSALTIHAQRAQNKNAR